MRTSGNYIAAIQSQKVAHIVSPRFLLIFQTAEEDAEKLLPILSNNTKNIGSESRMLKVSLKPTDLGHDESSTRKDEKGTLNSPIINEKTNDKSNSIQVCNISISVAYYIHLIFTMLYFYLDLFSSY